MTIRTILPLAALLLFMTACNNSENGTAGSGDTTEVAQDGTVKEGATMMPDKKAFQSTINGKQTDLYVLKNAQGVTTAITNYGGRVVSLLVPDKAGQMKNVVIGFDNVEDYTKGSDTYFGATIGRYGNRIAKGKFKLDGKEYTLATNNNPNNLHGGNVGFSRVVWDGQQVNDSTLVLTYVAKDMEEGFPGNLNTKVTYTLTGNNELKIDYEATTDKKTIVNLTNHSFFNLNGAGSGSILNHLLMINASKYTPVDSTLIPTGKLEPVAGTPFDFTQLTPIGQRINAEHQQLKFGKGYDHNYILNGSGMKHAAQAVGDQSGIVMDIYTLEPAIQFYSGNFMQGEHTLLGGSKDEHRNAFCLETQHYPDSPNQPNFPTTTLEPGKTYKTTTVHKFSVKQ